MRSALLIPLLLAAAAAQANQINPATQPVAPPVNAEVNLRHTVIVDVAKRAKDAVVYISTDKLTVQDVQPFANNPFIRQRALRPASTLGSGFIIHSSGYIVTNNHVIDRAVSKIRVQTPAGDSWDAEVVGTLPDADLAILKVNADHPLPTLPLGDSSDLMIGEPVIAIGNPVGLSYSVSAGIVSAVHRAIQPNAKSDLDDLIQTDAAINPGNSGGPLLNAYGQVIGINCAVRTDAQNIGFAIHVNRLRDLIPTLMNPEVATKLRIPATFAEHRSTTPPSNVSTQVELVSPDGNKPVESVNGRPVANIVDAYAELLNAKPKVPFSILAAGEAVTFTPEPIPVPEWLAQTQKRLGMTVLPNSDDVAKRYGLAFNDGILVTEVVPRSVAASTGLRPGDLIFQLGTGRVRTLDAYAYAVSHLPTSGQVQIAVVRGNQVLNGFITL